MTDKTLNQHIANAIARNVTPELLRALIRFDEKSGKYFWRERPREMFPTTKHFKSWNSQNTDAETLVSKNYSGYCKVTIFGKPMQAHRVIWAFHHGKWPDAEIDHINGDRADNRLENLRDVSHRENTKNQRRRKTNTSGYNGVYWNRQVEKWEARIDLGGRGKLLGLFAEKDAAIAARQRANVEQGYHPNHGSAL